jgi:tripartite-type tricarboxylate transporter receptor subunit TctC
MHKNGWGGFAVKALRPLLLGLALLCPTLATAQDFPNKNIRLIVPFPPGGPNDIIARVVGQRMSEILKQTIIIDNRSGQGGVVGTDVVAKAPPDGYTLLLGQDSLIAINPHLYAKMPFDPLKDLVPVATLVANQFVLAVNPSLPVRNFQEFVEYARRTVPPLPYASGGNGSQHHLSMEILKLRAGIDLLHVPFKGGTPATMATVAGDTAAMFAGTSTKPQIKAGKLRALAATGAQRSPEFPELPTIGEFYPGYEVTIWLALFAPAGTPEPVLARLRAAVEKALAAPDVTQRLNAAGGLEPFATTPDEFAALIRRDYDKYGKIVKAIGIKVD